MNDTDEIIEKLRERLPEILKERLSEASQEYRDVLAAMTQEGITYMRYTMAEGGAAGVTAFRTFLQLGRLIE